MSQKVFFDITKSFTWPKYVCARVYQCRPMYPWLKIFALEYELGRNVLKKQLTTYQTTTTCTTRFRLKEGNEHIFKYQPYENNNSMQKKPKSDNITLNLEKKIFFFISRLELVAYLV